MKNPRRFAACLLLVLTHVCTLPANITVGASADSSDQQIELLLYFTNPKLPEWANSCGAGEFVKRSVPRTKRPAEAALKLLFAGPGPEEMAKGMESLTPLGDYYRGVSIKNGTAIVNFRKGAERYLHVSGAACQQEQVLTPIVKTLTRGLRESFILRCSVTPRVYCESATQ